jgi:hypothetical protein
VLLNGGTLDAHGCTTFLVEIVTESTTQMSENSQPTIAKETLGLTGLTVNAMALIEPGAFLWLTHGEQCLYGRPIAGITQKPKKI